MLLFIDLFDTLIEVICTQNNAYIYIFNKNKSILSIIKSYTHIIIILCLNHIIKICSLSNVKKFIINFQTILLMIVSQIIFHNITNSHKKFYNGL
jgi:hypothetical protein